MAGLQRKADGLNKNLKIKTILWDWPAYAQISTSVLAKLRNGSGTTCRAARVVSIASPLPRDQHDKQLQHKGKEETIKQQWNQYHPCLPRWLRPRPRGSQRAYVSFSSCSFFSMMVWTMVEVTSPLQDPTAIIPHASAVTPTTWEIKNTYSHLIPPNTEWEGLLLQRKTHIHTSMLDLESPMTGRSRERTSSLFEPA